MFRINLLYKSISSSDGVLLLTSPVYNGSSFLDSNPKTDSKKPFSLIADGVFQPITCFPILKNNLSLKVYKANQSNKL